MKKATLCFPLADSQVLLAMKKRGFGEGKWNGFGGKVEEAETPKQAAVRELAEESGLTAKEEDLTQAAIVRFYFAKEPVFECHVFTTRIWNGEPAETEEMRPHWYSRDALPFGEMWAADVRWLPLILAGETIEARVDFDATGSAVEGFSYEQIAF